jgi:hypothetical protein
MSGDNRKRFCEACGKHVHNLSAMSPDEVVSLLWPLREQGGEVCGQVLRRPNGALVTSECPPSPAARRWWQFSIGSLMAVIAACAAVLGFTRWFASNNVVRTAGAISFSPPSVTSGAGGAACSSEECDGVDTEPIVEDSSL